MEYPLELLLNLLKIYSPSGKEGKISEFIASELNRLGFNVKVDEVGNVEASLGTGRPHVLLCGHMDTIKGFIKPRIRGRVIFGRGAVDAKAPLAALICGAKKFSEVNEKGKITILAVVDEEKNSTGIKHFLNRCNEEYDYAIFGEPSGAYGLTIGYRGRLLFKISCITESGHASVPQFFENAIYLAKDVINELQMLEQRWEGLEKERFWTPSLCVTKIRGGEYHNTVPSHCNMIIDVRVPPMMRNDVEREILSALEKFLKTEKVSISLLDECEPFLVQENSELIEAFVQAIREIAGVDCKFHRKTGSGDVNEFIKKFNIPCVVYGPGNSKLSHTKKENISIKEYLESIEIIKNALIKLFQKWH
ncbi:MAG: M20/M25/M40 family metallo-hydrolase [Candidatus Methanomethyliaceae archaeon]|nr:M20/M25/M40 family metallo-hydrolase [Candidatus Methanomethyliaceae archaeon]MDW7971061.1 M20/M25/M40 family metallo-hydrolase [Nitrososphaerota archaeon]